MSEILSAQNCGFGFSKTITIDHEKVSGSAPLQQFPVLISLSDNDLRTVANGGNVESASGYDVLFVDGGSGQQLAHQIETYNPATGTYVAWVRVNVVYPDFDTEIRMIYGNNQVATDPSTNAVWDENYQAVWHLHDDLLDGSALGNDGTNSGSVDAGGIIADGQSFDGSTDYIFRTDANLNGNIPALSSGSPNAFTLSGWINVDNLNNRQPLLSKQGEGTGNDRGFVFMMEDNNEIKIELFKDNNGGTRTEVYSTTELSTSTWYYMVATYQFVTDGTSICKVYLNGVEEGTTNTALGPIFTNERDLEIGRYFFNGGANYWMDGLIDEVRISDAVRSEAWIATEYENQNDPGSFYSVGSELAANTAPIVPVCNSGYKKVITIDETEVEGSSTHTNFPVLISLTDNDLRTVANGGNVENANGWDIVFTDNNLVPLDQDIESFDPTTGELVVWVKVPALPATVDYEIFMLYGNPNAFANPSTPCVWEDFRGVWHLHDDLLDYTSNDYDGANEGSTDNTNSQIADGQSFDGTDYIGVANFPNLNTNFTISGWIRTTDNTEQGQRVFCDDQNNSGGYALSLGDGGIDQLRFFARSMNTVILDGPVNAISNNTWYYVSGVADITNQDRFIYINGVQNAVDLTDTGTWGADPGTAAIGGEAVGGETGNRFEGDLDEIRVARLARSADWLETEYNNQVNPANFYDVGLEETLNATSAQNGNWDATASWAGGEVPTDGANVVIRHVVSQNDFDVILCNLTVESAANVDGRLEVDGGFTVSTYENLYVNGNGTGDVDANIRTMTGNEKVMVKGDLIINQSDGDDVSVEVRNAGDSLIVLGNILISHDGGDDMEFLLNNATAGISVAGNFVANMISGAGDNFEIDINNGDMTVSGTMSLNRSGDYGDLEIDMDGGTFAVDSLFLSSENGSGADQLIIDVDGDAALNVLNRAYVQMNGGDDFNLYINNNNGTSGSVDIGGDFYIDKTGGDDVNIIIDDANSELAIGGVFTINSNGGEQVTLTMNNGSLSVSDSMIINHFDGGQQVLLNINNNAIINTGDFLATLDNNTNQELLIDLDDAVTMTVNGDMILRMNDGNDLELHLGENSVGSTASLNIIGDLHLDHNPSEGGDDIQFIISDDCEVNVGGVFTMDTDGASGAGNFYTNINNNGLLSVGSNIVFTGADGQGEVELEMNGNAQLEIGGNFIRDAAPNNYGLLQSNSANVQITYNGTAAQIFADDDGAGSDQIEYEQVVINNTAAIEPQLTMEGTVNLTNSITFTDGVLQTTAANMLILEDGATATEGNSGSYVSGPIQKIGNDPFVFPLGGSGTWARLEISDVTGTAVTDAFTAEYFRSTFSESFFNPSQYAGNRDGIYNTSLIEYWDLSRDNGSAQPKVSLYWENNDSSKITDTADLVVAHYLGTSTWSNEGGAATGLLTNGKITTDATINAFSEFTFGSLDGNANPLPVELTTFTAHPTESWVDLNWVTASEVNNDFFTVTRSANGQEFYPIGTVSGAGNSNTENEYWFKDESPLRGTSYYQLKQTDFDGVSGFSQIEPVQFNSEHSFYIYPNPASDDVYASEPITGHVTDALGKRVLEFQNAPSFSVSSLPYGVYYVHAGKGVVTKLVVQ
ncbi:MAG: DUF2341 domain-containing protein [Salibacteraceae bacterium]